MIMSEWLGRTPSTVDYIGLSILMRMEPIRAPLSTIEGESKRNESKRMP